MQAATTEAIAVIRGSPLRTAVAHCLAGTPVGGDSAVVGRASVAVSGSSCFPVILRSSQLSGSSRNPLHLGLEPTSVTYELPVSGSIARDSDDAQRGDYHCLLSHEHVTLMAWLSLLRSWKSVATGFRLELVPPD